MDDFQQRLLGLLDVVTARPEPEKTLAMAGGKPRHPVRELSGDRMCIMGFNGPLRTTGTVLRSFHTSQRHHLQFSISTNQLLEWLASTTALPWRVSKNNDSHLAAHILILNPKPSTLNPGLQYAGVQEAPPCKGTLSTLPHVRHDHVKRQRTVPLQRFLRSKVCAHIANHLGSAEQTKGLIHGDSIWML